MLGFVLFFPFLPWLLGSSDHLQSLIHQIPGSFSPWALAGWPSWDHKTAFPWMYSAYNGAHTRFSWLRSLREAPSIHRSPFLLQVHCEVLAETQEGLGRALNHQEFFKDQGTLRIILQPPSTRILPCYKWGRCSQRMGTCPRPQSHTGGSPKALRCVILLLLTQQGTGFNKAFHVFHPFNSPLRDHLSCKGEKTEIREVKSLVYNLTASI